MKTPEELNSLKEELNAINGKLAELSDDELSEISGGLGYGGLLFVFDPKKRKVLVTGVEEADPTHLRPGSGRILPVTGPDDK